jgi:crotonobetainyl-CoA:carnitine CoA-transferase CaiB-like acyl-CoA transferase
MSDAGPLDGITIIDATAYAAGPAASRILADWGADVIKIEHPTRGDPMRAIQNVSRGAGNGEFNYWWELFNRNKKSITLDLGHPMATEIIHRLIADADVFMSHFRPYELQKFNLEYRTLAGVNPRLVYGSLTGYGRRGPDRDMPGYDWTGFWARSGAMHMHTESDGSPPLQRGAFGDLIAGMSLALGVVTALYHRQRTGRGQEVDASLLNAGIYGMSWDITSGLARGADVAQEARSSRKNPLVLSYRTADGRWLILCFTVPDLYWGKLCNALGRQELASDARFATFEARADAHDELRELLDEEFGKRTLEECKRLLDGAAVPWSPAQTIAEVMSDPQVSANDYVIEYESNERGTMRGVGAPVQLSDTPARVRASAAEYGQHTEETLLGIGYEWDDIVRFKEAGVIA